MIRRNRPLKRRSLLAKVFVRLFILPAHPLYHASTPFYTSQLLLCRSCYPDPAIHTRAEPSGFLRSRLLQLVQSNEIAMIYMTETCILGSMILIPFTILSEKDDSLQDIVLSRYPRRITDYFESTKSLRNLQTIFKAGAREHHFAGAE